MTKFLHFRVVDDRGNVQARGGATVAYVAADSGITYAFARCSNRDNYCKEYGRRVASGRLLSRAQSYTTDLAFPEFLQAIEAKLSKHGWVRA